MKNWKTQIESTLLVCRNEWTPLLWMVLLNFLLMGGSVFALSVTNALLVIKVGYQVLPVTYIISAGILIPYFAFYNYIEKSVSRRRILFISFFIYGLIVLGFRFLMGSYPKDSLVLGILYVFSTCILLLINFQYWSYANFIFHPRQAKRLFPLLGMGGTAGAILMGFSIQFLIPIVRGTENLLYLWGTILILSSLVVIIMYKVLPLKKDPETLENIDFLGSMTQDLRVIHNLPILRILAIILFIMYLITFIIYFKFNMAVSQVYQNEDSFSSFMGTFNGILNITILFYQLFLTGRVVSKHGLVKTLFLHPIILFFPVMVNNFYSVAFMPVVVARFIDRLCQDTFFQTASESMYGVVPDKYREQAMSFMKIIISPISIGISGLSLFLLINLFPYQASILSSMLLPFLFVLWGYSIWNLKGLYIETLFGNFVKQEPRERLFSYQAISRLSKKDSLKMLRRILNKGSHKMKVFAVELAGEMKFKLLLEDISIFLTSNEISMREETIKAIGKMGVPESYPRLAKIYHDQGRYIKKVILENLKIIDPGKFFLNLPLMLTEEKDLYMMGVMLRYLFSKGSLLIQQKEILREILGSEDLEIRIQGVKCLRYDKKGEFLKEVISCINSDNEEIVRQAILVLKETRLQKTVPVLIENLKNPNDELADLAKDTLVAMKYSICQEIKESIDFEEKNDVIKRKMEILSLNARKEDIEFFILAIDRIPEYISSNNLENYIKSINGLRIIPRNLQRNVELMISKKRLEIRDELSAAYAFRNFAGKGSESYKILEMLLKERLDIQRSIILSGLHLIFPDKNIDIIRENIFSENKRNVNIALEALENVLQVDFKNEIIPLFEKDSFTEEMEYIVDLYRRDSFEVNEILDLFYNCKDYWLKSWVLYTAGFYKLSNWRNTIEMALFSKESILVEHSKRALAFWIQKKD